MTTILLTGGPVIDTSGPPATAMVIRDGIVGWTGPADSPFADPDDFAIVVPLDGAIVTPAFVDTHVHATSTGLTLTNLDLTQCISLAQTLDTVAAFAKGHPGEVLIGHGWDETRWPEGRVPTAAELDLATGGAPVYLARVDAHSAVCSSALLALVPQAIGQVGGSTDGHLTLDAHHTARTRAFQALRPQQRDAAIRATLRAAASLGIGQLHENAGPGISGEADLAAVLQLASTEPGPSVIGYWGQLADQQSLAIAERYGLAGLAGDLFVDGSLGSHTACVDADYLDDPDSGHGHLYLDAAAVADHVVACSRRRLQAGFHVIGDRALSTVLEGFRTAARQLGVEAVRAGRHRLEHVQLAGPQHIAIMAELGLLVSAQPLSDALWGGADGMYASRIGADRALRSNTYRQMIDAGVRLAFGSDAPVMPLGGWPAIRAAVRHHWPPARLDLASAFAAHTIAGHLATGKAHPLAGRLVAGASASYAVWKHDGPIDPATGLPDVGVDERDPTCLTTVVDGVVAHASAEWTANVGSTAGRPRRDPRR